MIHPLASFTQAEAFQNVWAQARQAQAEQGSIATVGDGNISVAGPVLGSIYQVYQAPLGPRTLSAAEFQRVLDDYLTWVWSEYRYARLHGLQALSGQGAKRKPLAAIYTSLQPRRGFALSARGFSSAPRYWAKRAKPSGEIRPRRGFALSARGFSPALPA